MQEREGYDRPMDAAVPAEQASPRIGVVELLRDRELIAAALLFVVLTPVAAGNGGYFPVAWGWAAIGFASAALIGLVLQPTLELTHAERATLAAWVALAAWTAASVLWSADVTQSVLEVERLLVYIGTAWALLVIGARRSARGILVAALLSVCLICTFSLGTHLLPERLGIHPDFMQPGRLNFPLGYWNALGIFAAMGLLIGLGVAARPRDPALRVIAALPLPMLAATMYFTFGRGAWLAAAIGLVGVVVVGPWRLRYLLTLVLLAPWSALPVVWGASSGSLTAVTPIPARVEAPGSELTLIVLGCCIGSALTAALLMQLERRLTPGADARAAFTATLVAAVLLAGGVTVEHYGSPAHIAARMRASLSATSPDTGGPLATRLFSLSLNGRPDMWRTAIAEIRAHPVLGDGAGAYERYWLQHRTVPMDVRDAHSLYLETLAELGPVGLALLLLVLGAPLYAGVRARHRTTLVPAALGAYVAFLAHAAVDWDWEVPAVTITAIACAAALLLAARTSDRRSEASRWTARALPAVPVLLVVAAVVGLLSNRALSAASSAAANRDWSAVVRDARTAHRWAPWSYQPYDAEGRAAAARGNRPAAARAFRQAIRIDRGDWTAWDGYSNVVSGPTQARADAQAQRLNPLAYGP